MARALALALVVWVGLPAPAAADSGPWGWPLAGPHEVTRAFAPPASAYGAGHRGVDLPGAPGAQVRASAAGRVTYAGRLAGRGVVVVSHGALRTTYEPVTASVRLGQAVALGEVVGRLEAGHAGCAVAACLHWGLRRAEEYLDPVRLVRRGPVRLLPAAAAPAAAVINAGARRIPDAAKAREPGAGHGQGAAPARLPEVAESSWSLRAAEAPLGMAAVAALVLGIALIARPRTDPPGPASGGTAAPVTSSVVPDEPEGPRALLLDLDNARLRREAS